MNGLTAAEAHARLEQYGPNTLPEPAPPSFLILFLRQFLSPLIYILLGAAVVAMVIGDLKDSLFIGIVLLINGVIGAAQEYSAGLAAAALRAHDQPHAFVIRDGAQQEIDARDLVPGDLVLLEAGRRVPADIRLVEASDLRCDESMLTGESLPVKKTPQEAGGDRESQRRGMAFAGSMVTRGRGLGDVTATGLATEVGKIAEQLVKPSVSQPPLMIRMERFSRMIAMFVVVAIAMLGVIGFMRHMGLADIFMMAVGLAVAAIPEGLPVAISVALAISMRRMAKANVIVRNMPAVESLGSCTMIASDKTGTLTMNELTVTEITLPDGSTLSREADGDASYAFRSASQKSEEADLLVAALLRAAALPNEAEVKRQNDEEFKAVGDTVDVALLICAHRIGVVHEELRQRYPLLKRIPYEPDLKYAASFHRHEECDAVRVFAKGAPEVLIAMASQMECGGRLAPIDREALTLQKDALTAKGLRVLAFVEGEVVPEAGHEYGPRHLDNLVFLGLVGMQDPLRPEAARAIQDCYGAGIEVAMVTGDAPGTAAAIARQAGMRFDEAQIVTGEEVRRAEAEGEAALDELTRRARIYARVEPIQKLAIVLSLARNGHFVAVTGDGVNDAPALKHAHVGVAMGKHGTDVAKESADIIVTDDNFVSIVRGVLEGRVAYANIRKVIFLLVSAGAAELLLFLLVIPLGMPMPLLPVQLLWLNLVTNGVQHIALAAEKPEGDELDYPPRRPQEPIFDRVMIARNVYSALVMAGVGFIVFYWLLNHGYDEFHARNLLLLLFVIFENFQALNARSEHHTLFHRGLFTSPLLLASVVGAQAVHLIAMHVPVLADTLRLGPVTFDEWAWLMLAGSSLLVVMEFEKWLMERRPGEAAVAPAGAPARGYALEMTAALSAFVVLIVGAGVYLITQEDRAAPVASGPAALARPIEAVGIATWMAPVNVTAPVGGVLASAQCAVGDAVTTGQVCARFDVAPLAADVSRAQAARDAARKAQQSGASTLEARKAALARAETQRASRSAIARARKAVSAAEARAQTLAATVVRAEAALEAAQQKLGAAEIVSPIDGTVTQRNVAAGRLVAPSDGAPLFVIAPRDPLRVEATIDAAQAADVDSGDRATIMLDGQKEITGAVREVRDIGGNRKAVVIGAETAGLAIEPGVKATVWIGAERL